MGISCLVGSHHEKRGGGRGWVLGKGEGGMGDLVMLYK